MENFYSRTESAGSSEIVGRYDEINEWSELNMIKCYI